MLPTPGIRSGVDLVDRSTRDVVEPTFGRLANQELILFVFLQLISNYIVALVPKNPRLRIIRLRDHDLQRTGKVHG